MEFLLLGPLEAVRDGRSVPIGGGKQRALLGLLLLHANEVVSRDRLIDELWSDRAPGTAGHSLDVQISRLRKALEPDGALETRAGGYVLHVEPDQIDARRFERLLEKGRRANADDKPEAARVALDSALGLWRGEALADLAYVPFARTESERLEELRLVATEERIDAGLALGRQDAVVSELQALIAKHPLRERLRAELMLALYRSGRQADALRVFAETRTRLVNELGIEPGHPLRGLEQAILRQDPALNLRRRAAVSTKDRRRLAGVLALVAAGGIAAAVVLLAQGGPQGAQATAASDSAVLLVARDGRVAHETDVPDAVEVRFGAGSLWSVSPDGELTRVDPGTGKTLARIGLGVTPSGLAVGAGSVWVTDAHSPTLLRVDPTLDVFAEQKALPAAGTDETSDVIVANGSVWVAHGGFNPGAWVERIDPKTLDVQHRFPIHGGEATALAFANGAVWVVSKPSGELRKIDPRTNALAPKVSLKPGICCVAAGGGYVWAAVNPDATIWKLDETGNTVSTIRLPARIESLTYGDGSLWASEGEGGTVIRIDPTTDALRRYSIGHHLTGIDVHNGLLAVGVQPSAKDATAGLKGRIVRVARKDGTLFWSGATTDPALTASWDAPQLDFHYATCAKLYNYPDLAGPPGRQLVPEVAAGWPTVSDGGRTYTFKIRKGYRFSPPSNEDVTAESFRNAIERVLSPKLFPGSDIGPEIIAGSQAYHSGDAPHVSGVSAHSDTLVLRLVSPVPDLLRTIALNPYCAVPASTPVVSHGIEAPIPSAGPYYLAAHTDSVAVLKRNPNYHGPRPQHLDAIVYYLGIRPADAADQIANGKLDYLLDYDSTIAPDTAAARAAGPRYQLTPNSFGQSLWLAFNTGRPLFSDIRLRRAVQYALDRRALAGVETDIPATRLFPPKLTGFDPRLLYPLAPDLRKARALMHGRRVHAILAIFDPAADTHSAAFARAIRAQLAAIGISTTVVPLTNDDYASGAVYAKTAQSDIFWGGLTSDNGDPVAALRELHLPPRETSELNRIAHLAAPERDRAAAALAARIDRASLVAVFGYGAIPELISTRLGCIVHQPEYAGVDLAALCLRRSP
jgi:DNA-binding SARP family transcriptional activator/ABC-type transport system substrate-binding protein/streptogramin lyase